MIRDWIDTQLSTFRMIVMLRFSCQLGYHLKINGTCWHERIGKRDAWKPTFNYGDTNGSNT